MVRKFENTENQQYLEIMNVPADVDEPQMREILARFGTVTDLCIQKFEEITYVHVAFESRSQRKKAIDGLDGKTINHCIVKARRLAKSSPFHAQGECALQLGTFEASLNKSYIEFEDLPEDITEEELRKMCRQFGEIYEISMNSKREGITGRFSHVGFMSKNDLRKALPWLQQRFNCRRLPKSSPFSQQKL